MDVLTPGSQRGKRKSTKRKKHRLYKKKPAHRLCEGRGKTCQPLVGLSAKTRLFGGSLAGFETQRIVRSVAKRPVFRGSTSAERDSRFVGVGRELVAVRVSNGNGTFHDERAVVADADIHWV